MDFSPYETASENFSLLAEVHDRTAFEKPPVLQLPAKDCIDRTVVTML
jgi:hypothetical protein